MYYYKGLFFLIVMSLKLFAGNRDLGELPHGNVYMVSPEIDKRTTNVKLEVDRSGVLKGMYVHVVVQKNNKEEEISVHKNVLVPSLPATVYYHAHNTFEKLIENDSHWADKHIKIVLSYSRKAPVRIKPEVQTIIFGQKGLEKHALDVNVITKSVVEMYVKSVMGISGRDRLTNELRAVIAGVSDYLCSALRTNITCMPYDPAKNYLSLKIIRLLWNISRDLGDEIANSLIFQSISYMNGKSSTDDFLDSLLKSQEILYGNFYIEYLSDKLKNF